MTSLIDYAGLFPPASLDLPTTLANWRRYIASEHGWILGRLVLPIARLEEFAALLVSSGSVPGPGQDAWRLSVLVSETLDADIDRIFEFNRKFAGETDPPTMPDPSDTPSLDVPDVVVSGGVVIDAIELKMHAGAQIDQAMRVIPEQLEPFFEIPVIGDVRGLVAAMAGTGARAKIRTGGVTPEAFPSSKDVAKFLLACAAAEVPFKATAGLHHPIRGEYPLTYEPKCPRGTMFGFLNLFAAAGFARTGLSPGAPPTEADLVAVLEETNPRAFVLDDAGLTWRDKRIDAARLARVRETFATSFGSCSFEEPVNEMKGLGLL